MREAITMYSTEWCGHCRRLKRQLDEAGIEVEVIDVDERRDLGQRIIKATGGYRIVPSLDVGGRLLVNPTVDEVREAARESDRGRGA